MIYYKLYYSRHSTHYFSRHKKAFNVKITSLCVPGIGRSLFLILGTPSIKNELRPFLVTYHKASFTNTYGG